MPRDFRSDVLLAWLVFGLAAASAVFPARAESQQISTPSVVQSQADTTKAAGVNDGRAAAGRRAVGARAATAFVSGIPLGFAGPLAVYGANVIATGAALAGAAGIAASMEAGSTTPPPALISLAAARGSSYTTGFMEGYSDRLQSRRRRAALIGGAAGTATGAAALVALIAAFVHAFD
jgi:hypothetical protein